MPFVLKIEFTGLCAFVPERDAETLHVLLPEIQDGPRPVLAFDRTYLDQGGGADSDGAVEVDVRGARLELGAEGPSPSLPPEMDDLSSFAAGAGIKDDQVGARIILRGGTLEQDDLHVWSFAAGPVKNMPVIVRWKGECPGDVLRLPQVGDGGAAEPGEIPPLHPIDGEIRLRIENLPSSAREVPVPYDGAVDHFAAYYALFSSHEPPGPAES
jgi:hypothetical protein